MTLAHRLAQATPDQQRELIEELWCELHPAVIALSGTETFSARLDCGAYLDAVMLMASEYAWKLDVDTYCRPISTLDTGDDRRPLIVVAASTPALALASAIAAAEGV